MEKYLIDFLERVVQGEYGATKIRTDHIIKFANSANKDRVESLDDLYWEWTSIISTDEDRDMAELEKIILFS